MNVLEAGYDILVTLSICDGDFDEAEGNVIVEYLQDNQHLDRDGSFEPHERNLRLTRMDAAEVEANFQAAAEVFRTQASKEACEALLEFGVDLIMRDEELSEEENRLVRALADHWGVSLQSVVARAMDIT